VGLFEKDLNQGDHIYVRRKGLLYSHHGIFFGDGIVIHFKGAVREKKDPVVIKTDLESFLKGGKLKRRDYNRLNLLKFFIVLLGSLGNIW
jgi:hypothetical protein